MSTALFNRAMKAIAEGRFSTAVSIADAAIAGTPNETVILRAVEVFSLSGHSDRARSLLANAEAVQRKTMYFARALVELRDRRLEEAACMLESHVASNPGDRYVHYILASILPHLGRFDEANQHAARGTLMRCGDLGITTSRTIRFPDAGMRLSSSLPASFGRCIKLEDSLGAEGIDSVYLVCCDSRYFKLFGEALVNSLAHRAVARLLLHVHLVNPDDAAESLLVRLRSKSIVSIGSSREWIDFSEFSDSSRRTYLSCARYLVLPEVLDIYNKPALVADIDQLVVADLSGLLSDLKPCDVGLLRFDSEVGNILSLISASIVAVNQSAGGRRFAGVLRGVIVERMSDPAALSWHLDQASLAVTHLWCRDLKTLRLAPEIMDSVIDPLAAPDKLDPKALFWSITFTHAHNAAKLRTKLFQQFLDQHYRSDH